MSQAILFLHACPISQLFHTIDEIFEKNLQSKNIESLSILTHPEAFKDLKTKYPDANILLRDQNKPFRFWHLFNQYQLAKAVFKKKFAALYIAQNNFRSYGYWSWFLLAGLIRTDLVYIINPTLSLKKFSKLNWWTQLIIWNLRDLLDLILSIAILFILAVLWIMLWIRSQFIFQENKNKYRKKIKFFTPQGKDLPSARIRCYEFSQQLQKRGWYTEVISFQDCLPKIIPQNERIPEELSNTLRLWVNLKVFWKLMQTNYNGLLYVQKSKYNLLASGLYSAATGSPLILDMDDWEFSTPALRGISGEKLLKMFKSRLKLVVVASHKLEAHFSSVSPDLPVILLPTVPSNINSTFKYNSQTDSEIKKKRSAQIILGWAGVLFGYPILENLLLAVEAIDQIKDQFDIKLLICGGGPLWSLLEKILKQKYPNLKYDSLGWISPDSMGKFYKMIDVGLHPVAQNTAFMQAKSPTKVFEYMAAGLPVVASNIGETNYLIQDGENGFLAENVNKFAQKLSLLCQDEGLRKKIGSKAHEKILKDYNLDNIGSKLHENLEKL